MPVLSEAGTDRSDAIKFIEEYESIGAKQLSQLSGVKRNIKLVWTSDAFFSPTVDASDPDWHQRYTETSLSHNSITRQIFNILKFHETKEIFGLTYRDLCEMDNATFNHIAEEIVKMASDRVNKQKELEMKAVK